MEGILLLQKIVGCHVEGCDVVRRDQLCVPTKHAPRISHSVVHYSSRRYEEAVDDGPTLAVHLNSKVGKSHHRLRRSASSRCFRSRRRASHFACAASRAFCSRESFGHIASATL